MDCFPTIPLGWFSPWPVLRERGRGSRSPASLSSFLPFLDLAFPWVLILTRARERTHGRDPHGGFTTTSPMLPLEQLGTSFPYFLEEIWPTAGTADLSQKRQAATSVEQDFFLHRQLTVRPVLFRTRRDHGNLQLCSALRSHLSQWRCLRRKYNLFASFKGICSS